MTSLLKIKSPVPSDIEIAQSVVPQHISIIAEALGLEASEIDLYGTTKAKVCRLFMSYTQRSDVQLLHQSIRNRREPLIMRVSFAECVI